MQRFARIDGDEVVEIIEIEDDLVIGVDIIHPDIAAHCRPCGTEVETGWSWSEAGGFNPPEPEPEAPPVLLPITRRQLRLTLLAHGLLDQVEPAIAALNEPDRSVATIEWQDASEYRRDHPLISQIGMALALSEPTIDAMWVEAMAR